MIYLEETFNPKHASPEALDEFVQFAQQHLLPVCPRVGARLAAAWTSSDEWVCQATQVLEIRYYRTGQYIEKTIKVRQTWRYDGESGTWMVQNGLPPFE